MFQTDFYCLWWIVVLLTRADHRADLTLATKAPIVVISVGLRSKQPVQQQSDYG